ncbi:Txe/YoeB family addiction module toxin [Mycobacterium sp. HUMS_12744610]|uniref:Endoribonuclease YoeB n=1 Tax=Mycobacterium servetii TaxID=3237418 RepID=A0ABV4C2F2_9MYCO
MRSTHVDPDAWQDFLFWLASDRKTTRRITRLITEINEIGKPEPLKGELSGYWSRRGDDDHRLVSSPRAPPKGPSADSGSRLRVARAEVGHRPEAVLARLGPA